MGVDPKSDVDTAARREAEYLAATSEQLREIDITHGHLLVPGRPFLSIGPKVLFQCPLSLVIALLYCVLSAVIAYPFLLMFDFYSPGIFPEFTYLKILSWFPFMVKMNLAHWIFFSLGCFFLMNVGWAVMAADIARKPFRFRMLLAGLMGWVPILAIKELVLPSWLHDKITGGLKETMWGSSHLAQIYTAFWIGAGFSKQRTDLALARAMHKNGNEITDSVSSYVMYPIVGGAIILFLTFMAISSDAFIDEGKNNERIAAIKLCKDQAVQREINNIYKHNLTFKMQEDIMRSCDDKVPPPVRSPVPGILIVSYIVWLSFNRTMLFATIFQFMAEEADDPPQPVDWTCSKLGWWYWIGSSLYSIGVVLFFLYIFFAPHRG